MLTPPENGAGEFLGRNKCQHFPGKTGFRVAQVEKNHVHVFSATPNKNIQNHREPPYKLCLEKACLLCPPSSSSLVIGSFSHGSPIVDIHMVQTRLGTGVLSSSASCQPLEHADDNFWCQHRLVFRVSGVFVPPRRPLTIFFASLVHKYEE